MRSPSKSEESELHSARQSEGTFSQPWFVSPWRAHWAEVGCKRRSCCGARTWAPVFEKVTCDQSVPRANAVCSSAGAPPPVHRATVLVPPSPTAEEQPPAPPARLTAIKQPSKSEEVVGTRPNPRRSRCQISQMINQNQQIRDLLLYFGQRE